MRLIFALWIAIGVVYAGTTMAAELVWKHAYNIVWAATRIAKKDNPDATVVMITALAKGMEQAELARSLAPELHWIRSTPATIATENPMLDDAKAIGVFEAERKYDPYSPKLLAYLCLRYAHHNEWDKAFGVYRDVYSIWPESPITQGLKFALSPQEQPATSPPPSP